MHVDLQKALKLGFQLFVRELKLKFDKRIFTLSGRHNWAEVPTIWSFFTYAVTSILLFRST